jgi:hypothetical protein
MHLTNVAGRRQFVGAALVTAVSYRRILGANDRIRIGAIGTGERCQFLLSLLNKIESNEIVAVCDVYEPRRLEARSKYAAEARDYADHREILDRKDIDAVVIGTPDHWHVPLLLDTLKAGKDAYCEKPVTHTIDEGEPLIATVRDSKRVVQTGTQQRSWAHFAEAREEIAAGHLGQVTLIRTYWYQNHPKWWQATLFRHWKARLGALSRDGFRPPIRRRPIRELALVLGLRRGRHDRPFRALGGRGPLDHGLRYARSRHGQWPSRHSDAAADTRHDERRAHLFGQRCG